MTRQYVPDSFDLLGEPKHPDTKDAGRLQFWQDRGIPGQSLLDRLNFEEFMARQGWSFWYGPGLDGERKPCVKALFAALPRTAIDVDAWERRCEKMHSEQTPLVIPDKPPEEAMAGGFMFRYAVADETPREVPNFHDSPMSTKHLKRGN